MAIHFNGGTDTVRFGPFNGSASEGCICFWMRTTQVSTQAVPLAQWTSGSRQGAGFIMNNPGSANLLLVAAYDATTNAFGGGTLVSTSDVNTGEWVHVVFNYNTGNGQPNELYINGVLEGSANAANAWNFSTTLSPLKIGNQDGGFWASYVGDIAEVYTSRDRKLLSAEIQALANGYSVKHLLSNTMGNYIPFARSLRNRTDSFFGSSIGTTPTEHPKIQGGFI